MLPANRLCLASGEEVVVRRTVEDDAEALIRYVNDVAGETDNLTFGAGDFDISVDREKEILVETLKSDNRLFLVAELRERIIGTLTFSGGRSSRTAHVGGFGMTVRREYWGRGIGTLLVQTMLGWARAGGKVRKVNLRVRTDNQRAIRLYEKMGFRREGVHTRDLLIHGQFVACLAMGLEI